MTKWTEIEVQCARCGHKYQDAVAPVDPDEEPVQLDLFIDVAICEYCQDELYERVMDDARLKRTDGWQ